MHITILKFKYGAPSQVNISASLASGTQPLVYNLVYTKKPERQGGGSGGGSSSSSGSSNMVKQGWILENGEWYYYSGSTRDTLKKGWHLDPQDGFWYYLETKDGRMLKGWNFINEYWYYLNPYTPMHTWELRADGEWYYMNKANSRPLGSMYRNETTPDGFKVDDEGKYAK